MKTIVIRFLAAFVIASLRSPLRGSLRLAVALCLALHSSFVIPASGQVPQLLSYQGRVAVGTVNFDGSGQFKFALVNAAGTTTYWSNDGTSVNGSQPTAAVALTVTKGLYSVLLGDTSLANMTAIPVSVWANADVRLRVWFNDGTNGSLLLAPDQRLAPHGYLPDGAVSANALAASAVTSAKIATSAVGATQLATNAVTSAKIAAAAVTSAKIATGAVTNTLLAANAVESANIASGAVGSAQLGTGAVQSANIAAGAVTTTQLAANSVQSGNIATGAVTTTQLADRAVTSAKIQPAYLDSAFVAGRQETTSLAGGVVQTAVTFDQAFAATPQLTAPPGWTITGLSATGFTATASSAFAPVTVNTGSPYYDTAVAEVNGRPAIAYRDNFFDDLKFAIATTAAGTSWTFTTIESAGDTGYQPSLAVVNGRPAISYYSVTANAIRFVIANDASGASWGAPVTVESTGLTTVTKEAVSSLVVVAGRPAIAFHNVNTIDLKYAIANDAMGASWGTSVVVDALNGGSPSMLVVGGRPAIAYSRDGLYYVRANDATGASWSAPVFAAASAGTPGAEPSMAIVNGRPAICHIDGGSVKYVRAGDAAGSTWGTPVTVATGISASLAVPGGWPTVAYYDDVAREVELTRAQDGNGTTWSAGAVVAAGLAASGGGFSSGQVGLGAVGDNAVVSFYDHVSPFSLKALRIPFLTGWTASDPAQEAFVAQAASVAPGAVTSVSLANAAVTDAAIADGAVTTAKIADGAVTSADIADGAITAADLNTGSIGLWSVDGASVYRPAGSVGIGINPPASLLHLQGGGEQLRFSTAGGGVYRTVCGQGLSGDPNNFMINALGDVGIYGSIGLATNGTTRLFVASSDAGGNVGIGTTSPSHKLHVNGTGFFNGNVGIRELNSNVALTVKRASPSDDVARFNVEGYVVLAIGANVGGSNHALWVDTDYGGAYREDNSPFWSVTSDRRLKERIAPITSALETLRRINPVRYHYTAEQLEKMGGARDTEHYGVIAQDFQKVFPQCVTEGSDGYLSVKADPIMFVNAAAIKELHAKHEAAMQEKDAEIAELKRQVAGQKTEIAEIKAKDAARDAREKAREARLAKLEQLIPSLPQNRATTAANIKAN